jgi:hypothetical protein
MHSNAARNHNTVCLRGKPRPSLRIYPVRAVMLMQHDRGICEPFGVGVAFFYHLARRRVRRAFLCAQFSGRLSLTRELSPHNLVKFPVRLESPPHGSGATTSARRWPERTGPCGLSLRTATASLRYFRRFRQVGRHGREARGHRRRWVAPRVFMPR